MRDARDRGVRVFMAINTFPQPTRWRQWTAAVDRAAAISVDALILADTRLLDYYDTSP